VPTDPQLVHEQVECQRVVPLARGGHRDQWTAAGVGEQVDLRAQPTTGPSQRFTIAWIVQPRLKIRVIRLRPL
jgi:hypothetical protein